MKTVQLALATILIELPAFAQTSQTPSSGFPVPPNLFPAAEVSPTTVVAIVEGKEIRQADVDRAVNRALAQFEGRLAPEQLDQARSQLAPRAREELILQAVLEAEAERQKIAISDEEVEKTKKMLPIPPDQTLDEVLKAQGMTVAELDAELRRALKIRRLLETAVPATEVTDEEVKKFYEQHRDEFSVPEQVTARHILIAVPTNATPALRSEKRALAEKVRAELVAGGDFAELAKKYSDDPGSRDRGGVYVFGRGEMVPEFEKAAFNGKLNEISPLVETRFGYHIIQTTNREAARTILYEEAAPRIREHLQRLRRSQAVQAYIRQLREKAKVTFPSGS